MMNVKKRTAKLKKEIEWALERKIRLNNNGDFIPDMPFFSELETIYKKLGLEAEKA